MMGAPLVSAIMPTANRRAFVAGAIGRFLAQDYDNAELIILDDGDDAVGDLIPNDPSVRYIRAPRFKTLGGKRNAAVEAPGGEIILLGRRLVCAGPGRRASGGPHGRRCAAAQGVMWRPHRAPIGPAFWMNIQARFDLETARGACTADQEDCVFRGGVRAMQIAVTRSSIPTDGKMARPKRFELLTPRFVV
jgi:hypothetical protein